MNFFKKGFYCLVLILIVICGFSHSSFAATTTLSYNFDSDTVGQAPTDWTAILGTWQTQNDRAVSGTKSYKLTNVQNRGRTLHNVNLIDSVISTKVYVGAGTDHSGLILRSNSDASLYYRFFFHENGNLYIQATENTITSVAYTLPATSAWYNMKFYAFGTQLKGKIWQDGQAEPGTWNITTTDSTYASGYSGLFVGNASTWFDDVSVEYTPAAAVSAANSTVTANTNSVVADGSSNATITVTARDSSNQIVTGATVALTSSRGGTDTILTSPATTNGSGQATFTIKSSTAGTSTVTAVINNTTITDTENLTFTGIVTTTGLHYTSTLDNLDLVMDISYDNSRADSPIILVVSGYNGPFTGQDIIQRLARRGLFAIKIYKRSYGGSAGTSDDAARETYDLVDAVEYVKNYFSNYVDENNVNAVGYSGGGGNVIGLMTKFPDYLRSANSFFGISDYGYDDTYGLYTTTSPENQTTMRARVGGTPAQVRDNYLARAHYLAAKNNPYTQIQLFYDTDEVLVPPHHGTRYMDQLTGLGFTNVTNRLSTSNSTTSEMFEDYSSALSNYDTLGNGATRFTRNASGYINYVGDRTSTFSVLSKKFSSLRNYDKTDHFKASFNVTIDTTSTLGAILIGFRNSADAILKNSVSIVILNNVPAVRIEYSDGSLRDTTAFTTTLSTGTTYGFDIEVDNTLVTATLKNASGATLETKTVSFSGAKGFDGVNSFGLYNFADNSTANTISGTVDNISVQAWARWIHGYPQEGTGTVEGTITAENYFVSDILAGTWAIPTLNTSGSMFIPGFIKTSKFKIFLGDGTQEAGNLTYDVSGNAQSYAAAKTFTVEGLTGDSPISLDLYDLSPSTTYNILDSDLTHSSSTVTQATSNSSGTLTFSGSLGSTHQFDIYEGQADVTVPTVSLTAPSNGATVSGNSVSLTASASDNIGVSGVQFKLNTNTNIGSEDTTSTYGTSWDSTAVADGNHTLIAVARDAAGNYATSTAVTVTVDNTAPVRSESSPSGTLDSSVTSTTLTLTTNESATCKYSESANTAYGSMTSFSTTGDTSHSKNISGLSQGTSYIYYVKCSDGQNNINGTDYSISFSIRSADAVVIPESPITSSSGSSVRRLQSGLLFGLYPLLQQCPIGFTCSPINTNYNLPNTQSLNLSTPLQLGKISGEVSKLQTILSRFPEIYPQGLVTGYFGPLTKEAVGKFQLKYKLINSKSDPAYGYVGPKTRAKLNTLTTEAQPQR